jgi:hypothetical protein
MKCECNIDVSGPGILLHVYDIYAARQIVEDRQIYCNRFVSCLLKTKLQSNVYDGFESRKNQPGTPIKFPYTVL